MDKKKKIESYKDLEVYRELYKLHMEVHNLTLNFPDFEKYELGSQLRRSSNSAPTNLAKGWNNKHINIYLESINRAQGEVQETKHHLSIALDKKYISKEKYEDFITKYNICGKMLTALKKSLERYRPITQNLTCFTYLLSGICTSRIIKTS